jgi:hypothetical protein
MPACSQARLLAVEVAATSQRFELIDMRRGLGGLRRVRKLCAIRANVRHFMRHNEVVFCVDRRLHVVP